MDRLIHAGLWSLPAMEVRPNVRQAGFARMPMAMQVKAHGHGPVKTVMRQVRTFISIGPTAVPLKPQPTPIGTKLAPRQQSPRRGRRPRFLPARVQTEWEGQDLALPGH